MVSDYKLLATMSVLPLADQKFVRQQLAVLPARLNQAKERETAEMMGKLKEVSDSVVFSLYSDWSCSVSSLTDFRFYFSLEMESSSRSVFQQTCSSFRRTKLRADTTCPLGMVHEC